MTTRDVLIAAKKLIDAPDKWCQQMYHDHENEQHCLLGAIEHIAGPMSPSYCRARDALELAVPKAYPDKRVGAYNDDPERTHRQVMLWMNRAIKAVS